jgi:hypothetical protein
MAAFAAQHLLPREGGDVDLRPVDVVCEHRRWWRRESEAFAVSGDEIASGTRTPLVVPFQVNSTSFDQSIAFRSAIWP